MTDLYVYPQPMKTFAALREPSTANGLIQFHQGEEEYIEWRHQPGEYLYLHPYWYTFDKESKLSLVGKGQLKFSHSDGYSARTTGEDVLLDLETLLDLPTGDNLSLGRMQLNSVIVISETKSEPEMMFHPRDYVAVGTWLYRADKRSVLHPVGEVLTPYEYERLNQCFDLMKRDDPTLTDGHLYLAGGLDNEPPEVEVDALTCQMINDALLEAVQREMKKKKGALPLGHRVEVTSDDGDLIATAEIVPSAMPADPVRGKPFAMTITLRDKEGRRVKPSDEQPTAPYVPRVPFKSLSTEEDYDRFFQSLTDEQQEAFMQDCERLFGPPPAMRTHD